MLAYLLIFCVSLVVAYIITYIISFIYRLFVTPIRQKNIIKNKQYKSVVATEITKKADVSDDGHYRLLFSWEVDGKKYHGFVDSIHDYETTHTFYYMNNPRYAVPSIYELGGFEHKKELTVALTIIIFIVITVFWKLH